jgi:NADPH:quinone reductase-like Zn-dependent oxidoreductase
MSRGPGFCPEAVVPAWLAMSVPDEFSFEEAGVLRVALMTMYDAVVTNG